MNPAAVADSVSGAWGIRTFSGLTIAEVDGPQTDPNADWMAYEPIVLQTGGAAGTDAVLATQVSTVDVKAMRKMEELGQGLALAISNPLAGTAIDFAFHFSIGIKLP